MRRTHHSLRAGFKMADEDGTRAAEKRKKKDKLNKKKKKPKESQIKECFQEEGEQALERSQKSNVESQDAEKVQKKGRDFTVSIALPGSILENAQSPELRTYLAGQIARALVIFNVDEVVIFDESYKSLKEDDGFHGVGRKGNANVQLARILQYLECPQYLRKSFFPRHVDLQYAGVLNPLDSPHHMRMEDTVLYREGVVLDRPVSQGKGSLVYAGTRKDVRIDKCLQPGLRVTVKMTPTTKQDPKILPGVVVSPSMPRTEAGIYWGYSVRLASNFGAVFTQCPYSEGYDVMIGTSERGSMVDSLEFNPFKHLLIVFGGLKGLEASLESDESLGVADPSLLFHHYINTCPGQGSRTIRTEEAILITMSALRPIIESTMGWSYVDHSVDTLNVGS